MATAHNSLVFITYRINIIKQAIVGLLMTHQSSNNLIPDHFKIVSPTADKLHQAEVARDASRKPAQSPEDTL